MMDRFRRRSSSQSPPESLRRVSRREREESQRKLVVIGLGSALILLVLILIFGATYQYFLLPNQTLARVGDVTITRGDYWKVRKLELLNQINQYSQMAGSVGQEQAPQYQQAAEQAMQQYQSAESDTPNTTTLERMIDNEVLLQHMGDVGVSVSDKDIDDFILNAFAPSPLSSPTPTLPIDPTAVAWDAATAAASGSPSPSASAEPSPSSESPDAASPSPAASPTPDPADVRATATATFGQYQDSLLAQAGMSTNDFRRLVVRPEVALTKVQGVLQTEVPIRAEQVHAAHVLVATEDAAKLIVDQTLKEKDFAQVAKDQSSDSSTAVNGGDLGWFPQGVMVKEFDDVAFSLQPGEVSQPVHTQFGWHVIKVMERENDRPVTSDMLRALRGQAVTKWLDKQKSATTVTWESGLSAPTATPAASQFAPPPGSPPTPTPPPSPAPGEESPGPSATP
ncbi:MAG TPA: peptidylprolyl isomerase [Nitrolancea sp.]|nr:peptidylprolyl isomerase [Nitrolancea sp.]